MPPYLNVCGQGGQKSKFWAKNLVFFPKMDIFSGLKIFKSGSAVSPHRVLSNEVSHDPILIKNFFSKIWYIYIYIYK